MPLQPVHWTAAGLVCAPRLAPQLAAPALATCPLPTEPAAPPGVWPDSPAALVAGWYRRTDVHAPAPPGVRELVQSTGEGFGPAGHATTAMCLAALDALPAARAVDVGCGSGLLAQAWARLHRLPVLAVDLDPAAVAQTRRSVEAAGLGGLVEAVRGAAAAIAGGDLAGRVVLANVPADVHEALLHRYTAAPAAVVASGLRPGEAGRVVDAYRRRLGLLRTHAARRGRFECHVLVGSA